MAQRRCILHIGICKTGTTSIQYSLAANREALADAGIVVPRTYGPTHNHRHLTLLGVDSDTEAGQREWDVMRHRNAELEACGSLEEARHWVERSLAAELAMVPASSWVVFSSEQLSQRLLTENAVLRLRQALERIGFGTVRIVVYLREQIGLSMSWESMQVIAGHTCENPLKTPSTFNHQELLERWERVWGREALIVRTYARPFLHHGDVVSDFAQHALPIAGEYLKARGAVRRNERLGRRSISLLKWANHWLPKLLPRPTVEPVRRALVHISRLHWITGKSENDVNPATLRALAKQFKGSNQWVDQAYGTHLEESFGTT